MEQTDGVDLTNSTKPDAERDSAHQPTPEGDSMMDEVLAGLKKKIESELVGMKMAIRTTLRHAKAIGEYLIEVKAALKDEEQGFMAWVEENCKFSYPSAANYMKVAKEWSQFDESQLEEFTIREFLDAVAERSPRKKSKSKESPAKQPAPAPASGGRNQPPIELKVVSAKPDDEDDRPRAVESLEYGHRLPLNVEPVTTITPGASESETLGETTSPPVTSSADATPEDRVEAVARELDIPADKLRLALVRLGYISPPVDL